ncbi:MAG: hypothetical protein CFK48_09550 [Armatimonadetes bacterium CP1_7O]|nr:MAG: hypothetical protein CFK48_09550 [Armatimonadetes bacterium CP1_7O]
MLLVVFIAGAWTQTYQYRVLVGDRDAQRGVLYYDYPSGASGVLGACPPPPNGRENFYYGIAIHPQTGEIYVANVLNHRIDVLDHDGNCLRSITGGLPNPHGIAIHPSGRKLVTSHNAFWMSEYDLSTGQWRFIAFARDEGDFNVVYLDGIYGIRWHPRGEFLYAGAIGGAAEIRADGDSLTNIVHCIASSSALSAVWDVTVADEEGEAIVIAGTDDVFRGPNQPRLRQVTAFQLPEGTSTRCMASALFAHPEPDRGGLLFGIERAPDGTYWMSNYNRGVLYQLDPTTGQVLRRVGLGQQKLGLGIAILLHCELHNGDVNLDGCVDDADLLSVLFMFGSTERFIREDTNCDGIVDDADLLTVLFNFGSGC